MTETNAQSQERQNITDSSCKNGSKKAEWTDAEKRTLAAVTFPIIEMQKAYGRQMDAKLVMKGWQIKLAHRFTVDQILYALDQYTDKHSDFPTPKDIIAILEPEPPRITEAEFVAAQKWQERNGFPMFSDAKDTIDKYHAQERQKREDYSIQCDEVKKIVQNSVKTITQKNQEGNPE